MSSDVIIVGAGAAGTSAAAQLRARRPLVLDVGYRPEPSSLSGNLFDLRRHGGAPMLFEELIGSKFESLHNVFHAYLTPKLKAPRMQFVTRGAAALSPVCTDGFEPAMSFAAGGLANAWGAGLYRFTAQELAGFPIGLDDLEPYYDALTAKIGISGADDDLAPFFGPARGLQPPVALDASAQALLRRYRRRRAAMNGAGLYVGRPRLGVLTHEHEGRPAYGYDALEFFRPGNPAVYTPAQTLDEMIAQQQIEYLRGVLVERFAESDGGVLVFARDVATGERRAFACRRLVLAAGTLNTAKIALRSRDDTASRLPLLDNPLTHIPLLDPWRIGAALDPDVYPAAALNAVYAPDACAPPIQMTLFSITGALRSDYLFEFPLAVRGAVAAAKYLTPALMLLHLIYPDAPSAGNYLRLTPENELEIRYAARPRGALERRMLALFRRLGYAGAMRLCRYLPPGSSYHYAGSLPMTATGTEPYTTDRNGRLAGTRGVFVADAAAFSALPSKNHSFTMMANAMRIADHAGRTLA